MGKIAAEELRKFAIEANELALMMEASTQPRLTADEGARSPAAQ